MAQGRDYRYSFSLDEKDKTGRQSDRPRNSVQIVVLAVESQEALSRCFLFNIDLMIQGGEFRPQTFLGRFAFLTLMLLDSQSASHQVVKRVHGVVSSVTEKTYKDSRRYFGITLEPILAKLSLSVNSRVFQNKTPLQIIREVLQDNGIARNYVEIKLIKSLPVKPFCMQYDESDLNFINRLLQEYGVFYRFENDGDGQRMVLYDNITLIPATNTGLPYKPVNNLVAEGAIVYQKSARYQVAAGSILACSYRFSRQTWSVRRPLTAEEGAHNLFLHADAEIDRQRFESWSDARLAELHADDCIVSMFTTSRELSVGDLFVLDHSDDGVQRKGQRGDRDRGRQYWIIGIRVKTSQSALAKQHAVTSPANYCCELQCVDSEHAYLPNGIFNKPKIHSVLTATVVAPDSGAASEFGDIPRQDPRYKFGDAHCDGIGRVLIQFSWQQANAQKAKFWSRVCYPHAGNGHGLQYIPRIGDFVLVSFLNGDPDAPVIIGSVYGDSSRIPYSLPENASLTAIRGQVRQDRAHEITIDDNPQRSSISIKSSEGHCISMDETEACLRLQSAGYQRIILSDSEKNVKICSSNGHVIQLRDASDSKSSQIHIETYGGHTIMLDDDTQVLRIKSRAGHCLNLDDKQQSMELVSAAKHVICFDDKNRALRLKSAEGLSISLDDSLGGILFGDDGEQVELFLDTKHSNARLRVLGGDISISAPDGKLELDAKQIVINSEESTDIKSELNLHLEAENKMRLDAANLHSEAEGEYVVEAQLIKLN